MLRDPETRRCATGRLVVEADPSFPLDVPMVELPGGPGRYAVALGHTGRAEMQREAARVGAETLSVPADDPAAAWQRLDGLEQYLIRLWPEHRTG